MAEENEAPRPPQDAAVPPDAPPTSPHTSDAAIPASDGTTQPAESAAPGAPLTPADAAAPASPAIPSLSQSRPPLQFQPKPASYKAPQPPAPVTWVLAGLNALVFVVMLVLGGIDVLMTPSIETLLKFGANHGPLTGGGEFWRLFTCMFIHIGFIHIALNMWVLLSFGPLVENSFGRLRYSALYLLSGLGGSCVSVLWNPMLVSAGASGAIFGLFGGMLALTHVYNNPERKEEMARHQKSILTLIGYNLIYGLVKSNVDNGAHIGGLVFGMLAGIALAPSVTVKTASRAMLGSGAVAALILALACAIPARAAANPASRYNAYVHDLQPYLKSQDALVGELNSAGKRVPPITDAEYLVLVSKLKTAAEGELGDFKKLVPPNDEIAAIHKHMIDRAEYFLTALKSLEAYWTSKNSGDMAIYKQNMIKMGNALTEFLDAKKTYFEKYELKPK